MRLSSRHHGILMDKQETQTRSSQTRTFLRSRQSLSTFQSLCATDEDVVDGDVDQLDDVTDKAHDEDYSQSISMPCPDVEQSDAGVGARSWLFVV